jgi:hypothetical protein
MTCPQCGHKISEGSSKCPNCKINLSESSPPELNRSSLNLLKKLERRREIYSDATVVKEITPPEEAFPPSKRSKEELPSLRKEPKLSETTWPISSVSTKEEAPKESSESPSLKETITKWPGLKLSSKEENQKIPEEEWKDPFPNSHSKKKNEKNSEIEEIKFSVTPADSEELAPEDLWADITETEIDPKEEKDDKLKDSLPQSSPLPEPPPLTPPKKEKKAWQEVQITPEDIIEEELLLAKPAPKVERKLPFNLILRFFVIGFLVICLLGMWGLWYIRSLTHKELIKKLQVISYVVRNTILEVNKD